MFALCIPQHHGSTPRGTPSNFGRNRGGVWKRSFRSHTDVYLFIVVAYIWRHVPYLRLRFIVKCKRLDWKSLMCLSILYPMSILSTLSFRNILNKATVQIAVLLSAVSDAMPTSVKLASNCISWREKPPSSQPEDFRSRQRMRCEQD